MEGGGRLERVSGDHVSSDQEAGKGSGHLLNGGKSDESSEREREEEEDEAEEAHFHLTHVRRWPDLVCKANDGHVVDLGTVLRHRRVKGGRDFQDTRFDGLAFLCGFLTCPTTEAPPRVETRRSNDAFLRPAGGSRSRDTFADSDLVHLVGTDF